MARFSNFLLFKTKVILKYIHFEYKIFFSQVKPNKLEARNIYF